MLQNRKLESLKSFCSKTKKTHKTTSASSRFNPRKFIRKATANMTNIQSQKYSYPPEVIEKNVAKSEKFRDICDFHRLLKVQEHAKRYARADAKKDKLLHRRLREPLKLDKKVLALAERLKKRTLQSIYISHQQRMFHSLTASKHLWP